MNNIMSFNPSGIINSPYRVCENRSCHHTLEEHVKNECDKCDCKVFEKDDVGIYLKYDNCGHQCNNFLERKCPNCENPTSMMMGGYGDADPFHIIKLDNIEHGLTLQTALHNCGKCGLISYYDVGSSFDGILRDLKSKADLKKREREAQNKELQKQK